MASPVFSEPGQGITRLDNGSYSFRVWAPYCRKVELKLYLPRGPVLLGMDREQNGYFSTVTGDAEPGIRYSYVLDDEKERPDPCSRFQPGGVHDPSCIADNGGFEWTDSAWKGIELGDYIFYEAHIGTFTPCGTFETARDKIPYLVDLGITCLEIMPVAQFPGERNWGYDGVGLFAVQASYGGPADLKRLVDACHGYGISVCLDVVYNHFGPEGNYLHDFGPYFTKKYGTPWGDAINYDGPGSDDVRAFVIANALFWISEYHVDALRLDAIHGIFDFGAHHVLRELQEAVSELAAKLGRSIHVIAESDLNDSKIIRPAEEGGYGLAAQWSDDFHHAVHSYLTGEKRGYYSDFGRLADIAKAIEKGFVYDGTYSTYRERRHGNETKDLPKEKHVICLQNHDQVGNRAFGERLSVLVDFEKEKCAAVLLLLSPGLPLLFMGQEYSEASPFLYFIDHGDPDLVRAVREGRKKEFADFGWKDIPDPQAEETFLASRLSWKIEDGSRQHFMLLLYKELIGLRKLYLRGSDLHRVTFDEDERWLALQYRKNGEPGMGIVISFSDIERDMESPFPDSGFRKILDTGDSRYGGRVLQNAGQGKHTFTFSGYHAVIGLTS